MWSGGGGHHGHERSGRLPRHPSGVPPAPPGGRDAAPFLGHVQLLVCRRLRGPGCRLRQAGLQQRGARGLLRLGHCCDGHHQLADVDVLQPGPQFLHVLGRCIRHSDFFKHPQLGLPGFSAVRRVPGGPVVGRRVPHPLRAHPDPREPAADPEGPFSQAAVASGGCVGQLERQWWWLRHRLARGDPSQVIWGAAF